MSLKQKVARKAVKSTARHSAHGTAAKLRQQPLRTTTLLAAGGALGALVGWLAGRRSGAAVVGEVG
jgi:F0F1-type ATP synthase assembly protein I